jgi:glycosyltransferase involved in cell wall biosynthesis
VDKVLIIAPISSVHSARWIEWYSINGIDFEWLSPYPGEIPKDYDLPCRIVSLFELFFAMKRHNGIIHFHYIAKSIIPLFFLSQKKIALTFWGSDFERIWFFRLIFLIRYLAYVNKLAITTDAVHIIKRLHKILPKVKVEKINFGKDLDVFKRLSYVNNFNSKKLVSCRNFDSLYEVDLVLKAFALSRVWTDDWTLDVFGVGSQSDTHRITSLINSLNIDCMGAIQYRGKLTSAQIIDLYQHSAFHISASTRDGGISAAVAEGMLCGSVPIISDSVDNLLWVTALEGLTFQTSNIEDLTSAIIKATSLSLVDFKSKSDYSFAKISKDNDRNSEMKKCLNLYQNL